MTVNNEKLMDASDESIEEARHSQKCIGCNTGEIMDRGKAMVIEINKPFMWNIFYSFNNFMETFFACIYTRKHLPYTEMQWSTCIWILEFKQCKDGAGILGKNIIQAQLTKPHGNSTHKIQKVRFYMKPHLCGVWIKESPIYPLASKFLVMWLPRNVMMPMFSLTRFMQLWDF